MPEADERESIIKALVYLVSCALHDVVPDGARLEGTDPARLLKLAQAHSLTAIVGSALFRTAFFAEADPAVADQWKQARAGALRKLLLLGHERTQLLADLEKAGVRYMPLKGSVLRDLYPRADMREMTDLDILYDTACQDRLEQVMEARGYTAVSVGRYHHDVYQKPPVYSCEMHRMLFSESKDPVFYRYYRTVWDRLVRDGDSAYGYRFTDEDMYVYLLSHAYKHFTKAGIGLRMLVDQYVFLRAKADGLDWRYIDGEAELLGMGLFAKQIRILAEKLFADPRTDAALSEEEYRTFEYVISSGTHGTMQHRTENNLLKIGGGSVTTGSKVKYLFRRLFPTREQMMLNDPVCEEHPRRIPFRRVARFFRGLTSRKTAVMAEARYVMKR